MELFKASHETTVSLGEMNNETFLVIAAATCEQLGWTLDYVSISGIISITQSAGLDKPHEVTIRKTWGGMHIKSENTDNALNDFGKNREHVNKFADAFAEKQYTITEEEVARASNILRAKYKGDDMLAPGVVDKTKKKWSWLDILKPQSSYKATPIIALVNILVFVVMVASGASLIDPSGEAIYNWGGNYGPATLNGEWWRIMTCTVVHIGIMHLLMNMYGLIYAGIVLEPLIGTWRFVVCYVLTGITASLLSLYWHPQTLSAGASGAIFGIYGVLIAMLSTKLLDKSVRKPLLANMAIFVIFNLANGMKEGIDNAGHIGGLLGGLVMGYAFYPSLKEGAPIRMKYITAAVLFVAVVVVGFITFNVTMGNINSGTIR
jgi:rhomboid protease GluP